MAKTKEWKPRRVRSEEERGGSSDFIQLDEGEKFTGYALFAGDPAKDEAGYYEFLQHWVTAGKSGRSVPCAGDECPFCEDGEKPRDVANTLWLVTKDEKGNVLNDGEGELRIFKANSLIIKQFTEMRSEDEKITGRLFTVSRLDDRGNYMLAPKTKPPLTATKVKEHLKSKDAPDFDQMVTSQLRKAMEGVSLTRALDDDDEPEDEPDEKKGKKDAKDKKKSKKEDWPDELDEVEVIVDSVEDDGNFFTASHEDYEGTKDIYTTKGIEFDLTDLSEGDTVTVTTGEQDGDGDYILSAEPEVEGSGGEEHEDIEDVTFTITKVSKKNNSITVEDEDDTEATLVGSEDDMFEDYAKGEVVVISAEWDDDDEEYKVSVIANAAEPEAGGGDLPDKIEDESFTITEMDVKEQTMEVESEDLGLAFTLYFLDKGPASKVDFDDYEVGTVINLEAEKDSQGDMVATAVPEAVEEEKKGGKKGAAKKGGTKKKGGKGK